MLNLNRFSVLLLATGAALRLTSVPASAVSYYWDPLATGGAGGGGGTWNTAALAWATASTAGSDIAWVNGSDAVFGGTAGTVMLGAPISVGNLSLSIAGYTIATVAGSPLTLTGGITATNSAGATTGATTINGAGGVVLSGDQTVNVTNGFNISTVLSGSSTLTKSGGGSLGLNAANTFTGKFVVTAGLLGLNADAALGVVPATFQADNITLNGGGLVGGTSFTSPVNFSNPGAVTLAANRGITLGSGGGTFRVGFSTSGFMTVNGAISGPGALTKIDSGTLTLAADNTYQGVTNIIGTLQLGTGGTTGSIGSAKVNFTSGTVNSLNFNRLDNVVFANDIGLGGTGVHAGVGAIAGETVTLNGVISGAGDLYTNGVLATTGMIVLNGANTYTGATNITGRLQIGTGGTVGNLSAGKITFAAGTENYLFFNRSDNVVLANDIDTGGKANIGSIAGKTVTLNGALTGNGEFWLRGTGTVVVTGNANNNRTKSNVIEGGTLQVSDLTRLATSALGTGNIYFGQSTTASTGAGLSYTGPSVSTDAFANVQSPYAFIEVTNPDTVISVTSAFGLNSPVTGNPANLLTKRGPGTLSLEGAGDSSRMRIQVDEGTLLLGKSAAAAHAIGGTLFMNAGVARITGTGGDQIYDQAGVQMNGGTFDLNGHDEGFDTLTGTSTTGLVTNTLAGSTSTLTLGTNNGSAVYAGKLQDGAGIMALVKKGTGSLTFTGPTVVSGGASVTNGRLIVGGSLTGGITDISGSVTGGTFTGGLLGGTGTVGAVTTSGGILSPGASAAGAAIGHLKIGSLDMSANGTFEAAISTALLTSSLAEIQGNLSLGFSAAVLKLTNIGADTADPIGTKFTIMSYAGTWDGGTFLYGSMGSIEEGVQFVYGQNTYVIDYDAASGTPGVKNIVLTVVVPEPSAITGLFVGGLTVLGSWRRRRKATQPRSGAKSLLC